MPHRGRSRSVIAAFSALSICVLLQAASCGHSTEPPSQLPDTTSHNFTWKVEYLGDGASSTLFDVAILNDSLAYAVGALYFRDSLGNWDPHTYNAAMWNGNNWQIVRISFVGSCNPVEYPPIRAIWALSRSRMLVTNGGSISTYDGAEAFPDCRMNSLLAGALKRLYAVGPEDLYAGGNSGTIVHLGSGTWQKVESGTTLSIQDIWGSVNPKTGETEILAVASDPYTSYDRKILKITATTVTQLSDAGIDRALSGVWFMPGSGYFVSGGGIWEKSSLSDAQWLRPLEGSGLTIQYLDAIRGNGMNDIVAAGANGDLLHFNGRSWRNFRDQTGLSYGEYYAIAIKGNVVMAVGEDLGRGVVAVGKRVP